MAYEKQTWVSYDDNKTEEQNIQDGAVVTAERMNHLENGLDQHGKDATNPHKVTKEQVGLSNVTNVEQASKTEFDGHVADKTNPHSVTKAQVNLGNVDNYATANQTDSEQGIALNKFVTPMGVKQHVDARMATQEEAEAGSATNKYMTPLRVFQAISKWVQGKFVNKTGDEDVDGVKNFTSVPQINNIPIAIDRGTAYKEITLNSSIHANIKGGFIRLWRTGNIVVVGVSLSLAGPVRWVNLASFPTGFTPQSTGSFGIPLGSTEGDQLPAAIYTGSGNFRLLTSGSIPTSYTFQGSGVYYTEEDFPS